MQTTRELRSLEMKSVKELWIENIFLALFALLQVARGGDLFHLGVASLSPGPENLSKPIGE